MYIYIYIYYNIYIFINIYIITHYYNNGFEEDIYIIYIYIIYIILGKTTIAIINIFSYLFYNMYPKIYDII